MEERSVTLMDKNTTMQCDKPYYIFYTVKNEVDFSSWQSNQLLNESAEGCRSAFSLGRHENTNRFRRTALVAGILCFLF